MYLPLLLKIQFCEQWGGYCSGPVTNEEVILDVHCHLFLHSALQNWLVENKEWETTRV